MARLDPPPSSSSSPPKPAAVLETETTHVNLQEKKKPPTNNNSNKNGTSKNGLDNHQSRFPVTTPPVAITSAPAVIDIPPVSTTNNGTEMSQMRTIELSTGRVREGFANGDVIVTLLPLNGNLPWITPPVFRPELVPEELMAQGLTVRDFIY